MPRPTGLRERKKQEQRQRLADIAAVLFAERGYDNVSIGDVATASDVSYQTVYNYFPAKQDLGLDRAGEMRQRYRDSVRGTSRHVSPAMALWPFVEADVDRYLEADPATARGEHPALCVGSTVFRGFALVAREQDVLAIAEATLDAHPGVAVLVAHSHAAALVSVLQAVTDRIGARILEGTVSAENADIMRADARDALDELDRQFMSMIA